MSVAGIILAAGESSRMGGPKALLEFRGETFLDRLIRVLGEWCAPVIVVLGHDAGRIKQGLKLGDRAEFVLNEEYRRGQLSSLQRGLAAVPEEAEGVLFTLVDRPMVQSSTVGRIAGRLRGRSPGELVVIPKAGARHGHPVGVARELIPEFLALPPGAQARDVIHAHSAETAYVDTDDPGILVDVNDPKAYQRLLAELAKGS